MSQEQVEAVVEDLPNLQISDDDKVRGAEAEPQEDVVCRAPPTAADEIPSGTEVAVAAEVTPFDIYKAEGNVFVKAEKYPEALEKYELAWIACQTDDDRAMILNNRGVVYEKMGDTEKALEIFKEALTVKPEYIKVLLRRGLVHKKMKNYDLALEDFSEAQVLALKNHQTLSGLSDSVGQLFLEYTDSEIAKISASRTFEFPKEYLINTYFRGFYCDPISRMWKGLDPSPLDKLNDGNGDAQEKLTGFLAAMSCMKAKEFSAVPDHCTTEIENPDGTYRMEALLLRGSFYFLCGDCAGALADFQAITESPDASKELKSSAHLKAGLCQSIWGTCEETAMQYAEAEQLWKENSDVYYHAAVNLVDRGEAVPALALLEKGIEMCPDPKENPLLNVLRLTIQTSYNAVVYGPVSVKDTVEKLEEMERNGIFDVPECYEMYGQTLLLMSESCDDAFQMFDKAVELAGGCKFFQMKRVMASLMKTGDREVTLKALEMFTEDPDTAGVAYYHIGEISIMMQKFDEGIAAIEKSIEFAGSIYDAKVRVMGKMDYTYNARVAHKMKLHNIDLFAPAEEANKALE